MSPAGWRPPDRTSFRGQDGFTLVEVMLVVMLSSVLAVPLLGWMYTSIKTTTRTEQQSAASLDRNLLGTYLDRDVVAAVAAQLGGTDCAGGRGAGGEVVLSLRTAAGETAVYSVVASTADPEVGDVFRRVCRDGGTPTDVTRVVSEARRPATGWAGSAECAARNGSVGEECGVVSLSFSLDGGDTVTASFTRRIGEAQ